MLSAVLARVSTKKATTSDWRAAVLIFGAIIFLAGIGLIVAGLFALRRARLIQDIPTSKVRSIAMGLVELYGQVVPIKTFKSPFSQQDCVHYNYLIEEERRQKNRSYWVTLKSGSESTQFFLKDDTGKVLVDPNGAELKFEQSFSYQSQWGRDPPAAVKQFLAANRVSFEGFLGVNKTMRYSEWVLAPKRNIYLLGTAGDNPYVKEASEQRGAEDVMIQKGMGKAIYLISDKSEKEVLKGLAPKLKLFGGLACVIVGGILISLAALT